MKRRIRNILFATFALFFVLAGGYLTLSAQGFVIDFQKLKIEKTGAIFLKSTPRDANLFINDQATEYSQVIKNLAPGEYRLKLVKDGYHDWEKNLRVQSGLITAESQIKLWPKEPASETLIEGNVKNFWLTERGVAYEKSNGQIVFNDFMIRGSGVVLADPGSKFLITKEETDYFFIDLENPRSAVNLTHLFNSLKQRQLALPGIVPIRKVFFHPFSPNKLVVTSETSLYTIDVNKIQIEKIVTLGEIKLVALGTNDAFLVNEEDNLIVVNLLLKTSLGGAVKLGPIEDFKIKSDGMNVFILTPEKELKIYRRSSGQTELLEKNVREFEISPEEKRIAILTSDGKLKISYPEEFRGDVKYEAGTTVEIPVNFGPETEKPNWFDLFPNYLALLENKRLIAQETDERVPANSHTFADGVLNYKIKDKKIYTLQESGELLVYDTD